MGWGILVGSIAGVIVYFYLTFLSPWAMLTVQLSAFVAVGAVLLIVAWIGYTMATTPPPTPLGDLGEFEGEASEEVEGSEKEEEEKGTA